MSEQVSTSPYSSLKYPQFVAYIFANMTMTMALLIQEVVLGYYIYKITHNPLALGLIGLAEGLPYISLALFGGHFADKLNRKTILFSTLSIIITGSVILIWGTSTSVSLSNNNLLLVVYSVIALIGFSKGFFHPAFSSLSAFLVPKEQLTNAAAWKSSFWQVGAILGPGVAGFLYAYLGLTNTLYCVVGLLILALILINSINAPTVNPQSNKEQSIFLSLREGIKYVYNTKIIFYSISLDLFSVLFGGVMAILPVYSLDILHLGSEGLGILRAAPSVGAVITMTLLVYFPATKNIWRNLLLAIAGFGVATLVFALSTNFILSTIALFLTGAFDSISVVIRQAIIFLYTPDEMRGRVSSVNGIFVSSSNEIGAFESGLAAKLFGTVPSVVIGGSMTLIIVTYIWFKSKDFFKLKMN